MYINLTNRCSCDCVFCIRANGDSVGDADTLWLSREPTLDEIKADFVKEDLSDVIEIIFCGYGEPLERAELVVQVCEFIKSETDILVRLNTNGIVGLIAPDFDVQKLSVLDAISISLNSDNAIDYHKATRSIFGETAFNELLSFAQKVNVFTKVYFTVVKFPGCEKFWNEQKCKKLSEKMGISLRIREYSG